MKRRSFLGTIGCLPVVVAEAAFASTAPSTAASTAAATTTTQSGKRPRPHPSPRRIGIAFGGGSLHGIAHVGALQALLAKGLEFQFITGTSAGAIIGVLAAAKMPIGEIEAIARRVEWPGIRNVSWSGKGLMQNTKLQSLIDSVLGNRRLEQLPVPFGAIATDITSGARVIIRKGPAGAAISASCAIPVMFEPIKIDGRELVDGGLTEPVPVIAAREMGADFVIGVDVAFRPGEEPFQGLTGAAFQTMHIMANALINEQLPRADIAIRMRVHALISQKNSHEALMAAGHAAAMKAWPRLAAMLG